MLNTVLNSFFKNIRTLVAAGVANAVRAGIADAIDRVTPDLSLAYQSAPEEISVIELAELDLEDLLIE
jgi:hypothetical protein